jgi:iron complex outermembrane receptor protein
VQKFVNPRALVATAVALALQGAAFAADTATGVAAPAAEAADEVHTLVVTARRRSEDVQDVPVAVSVLDAATLESTGSFNVARLQQLQPSLQFFSTNARNSAANIRGLGAPFGLTNDGIEQGVGLYVDDVYYARAAASTFDFLDVERLEVLRGPQGTLYGKNTTAGTINITTRAPTFTPEGNAEISFGNLGLLQTKAAISGPILGDTLAGRLAVSSTNRHGTIYNVKSTNLVNEIDNFGIRGQILWRVNDALDVTFAGDYNVQDPECCAQIFVRVGTTQRPLNRQYWALAALQNYAPPSTDPFDRVTDLDAELRARNELGGTSIRAVWDLGAGTFTSVTSWRYWDWTPANDRDFTGLPIALKVNNPTRQDQATQEFRYAYTGDRIDYVVGLFGYNQSVRTYGIQVQGPAASRWLLNPTSAASLNPATLNNLTSNNDIDLDNTSVALFGQLTWRLNDKLRFEPGLRLNHDSKDGSYISTVTNGTNTALTADQRGVLAPQSYTAKFSDWNVSGDAKFSYAFTPDVLGYVSYARSFKTGGINLNGLPLDGANNPILAAATIRPEKINHYEAGLKTQFLNRTATLNVTGFWTDIDDFQTTVTNGQFAVVRGYLANAEKVRVRGVETEFSINPTDRFSAYVNAAFTDHEYVRFVDAPCPPELSGGTTATGSQVPGAAGTPGALSPANCNISGQWLPGISKWALSYGTQYEFPGATLLGREGKAYVGFDGSYRSRYSSNASRSAYTDISGYALANVRVGFRGESGWDVYGWVRNALDRDYFEVLATTPGNTGLISGQPADPRTYGVTVRVDF